MKKILLSFVILLTFLTGCQKDDELSEDEKPDARLKRTLEEYKTQLVNAPYGWKTVLYPAGGAGYSFLFKFGANDRVSTLSDINATTANTALESTYRIRAQQRLTLIFDTYTYLHILADPDERVNGGDRGSGLYSDFEFSIDEVTPDRITLTGTLQNSKMVLVKATQEDAANYIRQAAAIANAFERINNFTVYFKRLTIGTTVYDISVNTSLRLITFLYFEGNTSRSFTTSYAYTQDGVAFIQPFTSGTTTISGFTNITYSTTNNRINLLVNNIAATIQEAIRPARVNTAATNNFDNNPDDSYWISESGFIVDGVPDAHKITTVDNFYFIAFWPKYGTSGNTTYDLMGIVTFNQAQSRPELNFGPAAVSTITTDGRIVYTYLGMLGTQPAQAEPMVTATRQLWTDPQGFFVVQTSENSVDLVSAKDAKAWISLYK